jgi:RNA polymerase sigma-70 factor (ECF subfamily)
MAKQDSFIPTRKSLLTRLKNWDDQEGWREFFETYWRLIYSVASKSGFSDAQAQDIVQETVISVAKKMRSFKYDFVKIRRAILHTKREIIF